MWPPPADSVADADVDAACNVVDRTFASAEEHALPGSRTVIAFGKEMSLAGGDEVFVGGRLRNELGVFGPWGWSPSMKVGATRAEISANATEKVPLPTSHLRQSLS